MRPRLLVHDSPMDGSTLTVAQSLISRLHPADVRVPSSLAVAKTCVFEDDGLDTKCKACKASSSLEYSHTVPYLESGCLFNRLQLVVMNTQIH